MKGANIKVERQVQLPIKNAFQMSMESIRIRFWRSMITAAGTLLGIAFLSSVLITTPLEESANREDAVRLGTMKKVYSLTMASHQIHLERNEIQVDNKPVPVENGSFLLDGKKIPVKNIQKQGSMQYVRTTSVEKSKKDLEDEVQTKARRIWLVIMSLLVCSVGIANAMLMSVTERFKEIGTMKCLGALDKFVVELFLLEATFMGIIASTIGTIVGFGIMALAYWMRSGFAILTGIPFMDVFEPFIVSVAVGTGLTVVSTIWPAWKAAQLPPAAALRSEI